MLFSKSYLQMGLIILHIVLIAYIILRDNKRRHMYNAIFVNTKKKNYLQPVFLYFTRSRLFRKSFEKTRKRIQLNYPASMTEINDKTTRYLLSSISIAGGMMLLVILTSGGDVFYIGSGIAVTYILYTHIIRLRFESMELKLLEQLKEFLSDVRSNYYKSGKMVDNAIYMSMNDAPYEMSLHAQRIYKALTSINIQEETDRYIDVAPNRFFLTLLAICSTIIQYGDKTLEDGQSMFVKNLGYLKDELNIELLKIKRNRFLFSGLALVSILPLLFIKPIEWWATSNMPQIADYYQGSYGTVCMVGIFAVVITCYTYINNLADRTQKEIKEHLLLEKLSSVKIISKILTREMNRNYTKAMRINNMLKMTGEHMGYKQYLLKCILFGIAGMFSLQIVIMGAQWQEKRHILNDFASAFDTSFIEDEAYRETMRETAMLYVKTSKWQNNGLDREALASDIMAKTEVKNPTYAAMIADELASRADQASNIYYKWYFLLLVLVCGVVGYNLPYLVLKNAFKQLRMGMEDEVNQFQTIILMLMHVDGMSIGVILEWMERFAYCFKEPISQCTIELPYGEEKALTRMRDSEQFPPFVRFVNNMLTVNNQGLVAAFEEVKSDRIDSQENRKIDNEILIKKRSSRASFIAIVPLAFEIVLYLIYPMLALSTQAMSLLDTTVIG